ncbi:ATP-binding cassette sub-family C member 4-like [Montipora foliosa]|uniref:ATP-binding cassette sub-family C member 4-like n=1 Tax=Montipora foliosa TaxID=591990 RepID=UPI0035F0FF58
MDPHCPLIDPKCIATIPECILIDGVDIGSINHQEARRAMAAITQDPVLFVGTLKRNIDPFSEYSDKGLWTALEEVLLKTLVKDLQGQLEFKLKESGTNLRVGEREPVCLARALVQNGKIIMDEPPLMWISVLIA